VQEPSSWLVLVLVTPAAFAAARLAESWAVPQADQAAASAPKPEPTILPERFRQGRRRLRACQQYYALKSRAPRLFMQESAAAPGGPLEWCAALP